MQTTIRQTFAWSSGAKWSTNANGIDISTDAYKHWAINRQCNHYSSENLINASDNLINVQKYDDFSFESLINPQCSHNESDKTLITDNENLISVHSDDNAQNDNLINKVCYEIF